MSDLVGKSVLIEITCVDQGGVEIDTFQTLGTIEEVDERWIGVRRDGLSELFGLPPAPDLLEPAPGRVYKLDSTGERIETPDYLATLRVNVADAESVLTIRGVGYVPE